MSDEGDRLATADKDWKALVEILDGRKLFSPLGNSSKIKYTTIAASENHVVLGANTGGVYCFSSSDFRYLRLLANKEGAISLMRFSPAGDTLAVATAANNVCFWEFNVEETIEPKRFHVSTILKSSAITDMTWDKRGNRLFYGDEQGRVAIAYVPKLTRKFGTSSLFKKNDEIIHMEKASIVQLDYSDNTLLVSSILRCCLLRIQQDFIEPAVQVGTKMRDGPFGACFHRRWVGKPPVIYSARPGGRLWEANIEGKVVSTLKMRDLIKGPPTPLIRTSCTELPPSPCRPPSLPTLHFRHISIFKKQEMVAWLEPALFLYHPASYDLPVWTMDLSGIINVRCAGSRVYVLHDSNQKVTCLSVLNMEETLTALVSSGNIPLAQQVVMAYPEAVLACFHGKADDHKSVSMVLHSMLASGQPLPGKILQLLGSLDKIEHLPTAASSQEHREEVEQTEASMDKQVLTRLTDKEIELPVEKTIAEEEEVVEVDLEGFNEAQIPRKGAAEDNLFGVDQEAGQLHPSLILPFDLPGEERIAMTAPIQQHPLFPNDSLPRAAPSDTVTIASASLGSTSSLENGPSSPRERFQRSLSLQPLVSTSPQHPPITVRIGSIEGEGCGTSGADDVIAVNLKKDKKRKGKKSKSRGSVTDKSNYKLQSKSESSPNLEDILEADYLYSSGTSPSHQQCYSNATSTESSPYTSRTSSPPHQDDTEQFLSIEGRAQSGRSMSLDLTWRPSPDPCMDESESSTRPGMQRSASFMSKVRSIAQQARPTEMMRDFLSSISPTPVATAFPLDVGSAPTTSTSSLARSTVEENTIISQLPSLDKSDHHLPLSPTEMAQSPLGDTQLQMSAETAQFISAVEATMQSLMTPTTLSSIEQLKQTIHLWLQDLRSYHDYLTSSCAETSKADIFSELPYCRIDSTHRQSVKELATLSLELEMFSCEGDREKEEAGVQEFLELFGALVDVPRAREVLSHYPLMPMCSCWRKLARINTERLGSSLEMTVADVREQLLAAPGLVPAIMTRVYEMNRETFIKACSQTPEGVGPWEVGAVCLIDCQEEGMCDRHTMASYLDGVLGEENSCSQISTSLLGNTEMLLASLSILLSDGPEKKETVTDKGNPLPWSHELPWSHQTSLACLIGKCVQGTQELQKVAADMCFSHGYWRGYLSLCLALERKAEVLQIVVSLRDKRLLQEVIEQGKMLVTVEDWKSFLRLLKEAELSVVGTTPHELSWDVIEKALLAAVGPKEIGNVLDEELGKDGMDLELGLLHQLVVELTAIHRQQRALAHCLLEKLDRYLWAPRPLAIGPRLLAVQRAEDREREESVGVASLSTTPLSTTYMEDASCHWGVRLPSTQCCVCQLPVTASMSEAQSGAQSGAIALHCGHVYHRQCLPEQACLHCFSKNFTAKLTLSSR